MEINKRTVCVYQLVQSTCSSFMCIRKLNILHIRFYLIALAWTSLQMDGEHGRQVGQIWPKNVGRHLWTFPKASFLKTKSTSLFFLFVYVKPIFLGIPSCRKTVVVCPRIHHCALASAAAPLVVALAYQIYNEYSSKGFHLACLLTLASMCARDAQCSVEYLQSACPFAVTYNPRTTDTQ